MRILKTSDGQHEFHSKLNVRRLDEIQNAVGIQLDGLLNNEATIVPLFTRPGVAWKIAEILIGEQVRQRLGKTPAEGEVPEPVDIDDHFEIDAVMKWIMEMVTDFHPSPTRLKVSKLLEEIPNRIDQILKDQQDRETQMMSMAMSNPEILSALATGLGGNLGSILQNTH